MKNSLEREINHSDITNYLKCANLTNLANLPNLLDAKNLTMPITVDEVKRHIDSLKQKSWAGWT